MNDSQAVVADFLARWDGGTEAMIAAMHDCLSDDVIWKNSGFPDAVGLEASVALMRGFCDQLGISKIGVETTRYVTQDGDVVTERRDDIYGADGARLTHMDVLGIFTVKGGKIVSWNDYADPSEALAIAQAKAAQA